MLEQVNRAVQFLRSCGYERPRVGIILGTGLGALVDEMEIHHELSYADIPHFPLATVEFHKGRLIYGQLSGAMVVVMQGRFHYYEGHAMSEVVFPVRVMHGLGIDKLLISNAGGCMNRAWKKGELMLLDDHINLQPDGPLRHAGASAFGSIFTDMSLPYDRGMNEKLLAIAVEKGITLHKGVYVAVMGPHLETRAEYRYLRRIGGDVVGMSTVPEVIVANQMGLPVSAVSVLTDECDPDHLLPVDIADILSTAKGAEGDLIGLFKSLLLEI